MKVFFVGAGPGNPDLLTVRADRLLRNCGICIYAGSLVSPAVVAVLPEEAERHNSAEMNLDEILTVCRSARDRGIDVIRLHSGDSSIYGAIREQMNGLDTLGIAYEVVPGASAFQASAAALKMELTAPEIAQTIILTRTSGRTPLPAEQVLDNLARSHATLCIYLSGHKVGKITAALVSHYGPDCPAAVVFHASWSDERIVAGTLDNIAGQVEDQEIGATSLIIVGRALARDIPASKLYDAAFSHQYRKEKPS